MIAIVCDDKRQKSTDGENHRTRNMECLDLIYDALLHQTGAPEDFFKRTTYWIVWNLSMLRVIPPMRTVWSWIWISKHGIQFLFNREVFLGYPCDSWSWPPNVNLLPGDISQPGRIPPWLSATSIVNMTVWLVSTRVSYFTAQSLWVWQQFCAFMMMYVCSMQKNFWIFRERQFTVIC